MNLCRYLSALFLTVALVVMIPLGLFYVTFGITDELVRLGHVELCIIALSFVTFIGSR